MIDFLAQSGTAPFSVALVLIVLLGVVESIGLGSSAIEIQAQQLGIVVVQERDEVQKNRNAAQAIEVLNALVPVRAENKQASPTCSVRGL